MKTRFLTQAIADRLEEPIKKLKSMTNSREVFIKHEGGVYFVMYKHRKKGQRYIAAQFQDEVGIDYVMKWIIKNPKIYIVDRTY